MRFHLPHPKSCLPIHVRTLTHKAPDSKSQTLSLHGRVTKNATSRDVGTGRRQCLIPLGSVDSREKDVAGEWLEEILVRVFVEDFSYQECSRERHGLVVNAPSANDEDT